MDETRLTQTASIPLGAGTVAPDFNLSTSMDQKISLKDYKGKKNVLLVFYPADFSPTCGSELTLFTEIDSDIKNLGTQILGISVDNYWCHQAYAEAAKISFPLLSDFEPKGAVSKMYGAYESMYGFSSRALFLIDRQGVIRWSYLSPLLEIPGADQVLEQLENLKAAHV